MAWAVEFVRRSLKGEPMVMEPPLKRRRTSDDLQGSQNAYAVAAKLEPADMPPLEGPEYLEYISDEELDDVQFI
eukprot:6293670-Amphidinium_carterae.1